MKRVLFDTNIILDIALKRTPYYADARSLFKLIDERAIAGSISATTVTDIYYVAKKESGHEKSIAFLRDILEIFDVLGVDRKIVKEALDSEIKDFEDAIQFCAAKGHNLDVIITRNTKDFKGSQLKVLTPKEFLKAF